MGWWPQRPAISAAFRPIKQVCICSIHSQANRNIMKHSSCFQTQLRSPSRAYRSCGTRYWSERRPVDVGHALTAERSDHQLHSAHQLHSNRNLRTQHWLECHLVQCDCPQVLQLLLFRGGWNNSVFFMLWALL